jgi:hypothetical protein
MVNYQNAKIYKLVGGGLTYYGSTCSELRYRLSRHKNKTNGCKSKLLFDTGDKVEIILVEKYPCNDKMELHQRERYFIENFECVNKYKPYKTQDEYKEQLKKINKKYRDNNKDKIKESREKYKENNKEKAKESQEKYRKNNKEKIKEINERYYEKNKDKIRLKKKQYYEKNKDKMKE